VDLDVEYASDSLNRRSGLTYPAEYGQPNSARKGIDYTYGVNGLLSGVQIDKNAFVPQLTYNSANQITGITIGPPLHAQVQEIYDFDPTSNVMTRQRVLDPIGRSLLES
jgi:hypothetical protein